MIKKTFWFLGFSFMFLLLSLFLASFSVRGETIGGAKFGFGFRPNEVGKIQAGKDFVPGELIVAYYEEYGKSAVSEIQSLAASFGGLKTKEIRGALLLKFPTDEALVKAAKALAQSSMVRFVERNGIMRKPPKPEEILKNLEGKIGAKTFQTQAVSQDPGTSFQYHHTIIRNTVANITSTTPPTVAVIDRGVDYTHPDLEGKVIIGKNCIDNSTDVFDDNGHGTHVAGIIAAKAGNNQYGEGVCPNCKILAIKVLNSEGWGTFFDVACGMQYARAATPNPPTKVINMSLGTYYDSNLIRDEVVAIKNASKILVAVAGNSNRARPLYPAAYPETAFRVMATEQNDCRTFFSNLSPPDDPELYNIAAPGWKIPSTVPSAGFESWSGTSMATPIVAGALAVIWGENPSLTREQLISKVLDNAQTISCGFPVPTKRIDIQRALTGTPESRTVIGRLLDPFTGKPPLPPLANATVTSGTTVLGSDTITRSGFYEINLGGNETTGLRIKAKKAGYVTSQLRRFNLNSTKVTGPFTDAYPKVRKDHATITLDWKTFHPIFSDDDDYCTGSCLGWEFDLYVKTPAGTYVTWYNPGSLNQPPYVYFPRDSFSDAEPLETIVISPNAQDGEYIVFVKIFAGPNYFNPKWAGSRASIQVFSGGTQKAIYHNPPSTCGTSLYWYVGKIVKSGTTYTWTNVNYCTEEKP